jgi:hypothetical protein
MAMRISVGAISAVLLGVSACASSGAGGRIAAATCTVGSAAALVGKVAPDDATILGRTGGTIVRRIAPGDMTTKDYRVERVTITVDDGRVIAASCG